MIDHKTVRAWLHYNPQTGVFTWRVNRVKVKAGDKAGWILRSRPGCSYRQITIAGKKYYAHRLAWFWMTGRWPPEQIDHKNSNGLDNRWANLRLASRSQNGMNSQRRLRNKSGFKGVCRYRNEERFTAQIKVGGKHRHLGYFATAEEAHAAYCAAAQKYFGEYARSV